jgi:hypothetical protein
MFETFLLLTVIIYEDMEKICFFKKGEERINITLINIPTRLTCSFLNYVYWREVWLNLQKYPPGSAAFV